MPCRSWIWPRALRLLRYADDEVPTKVKDVSSYLDRHRIHVNCERLQPLRDASTAQCLLQFVSSRNIDLIVAGGYGHSRLGEWIFGGVTRALLRDSPICCLLAH
jgi:nucleotide-binding universal stress UspA family protein